jgi:23S rRNA pseudouridine2605 synthase
MADKPAPEGDRIAKVIARAGLASRREAEAWIAAGRVSVNGKAISSPALNIGRRDRVTIDGQPLPGRSRTRLFLCNKPRGLVTTHSDPDGRPTIFAALPKHLPRLISVGRLDMNTEGLLLLTNDGGLARALELPATGWLRRYRVRALGRVSQETLDGLKKGITIEGVHYGPIEATLERQLESNCWLSVGIREGKNREVRRVMESLGLKVSRLIRVSFGPFELGPIAECDVKEVETAELKKALGPEIIKLAEADFDAPLGDDDLHVPPQGKRERGKAAQGQHERGREERGTPSRRPGERPANRDPGLQKHGRNARPHSGARNDKAKWPGRTPEATAERPATGRTKHKRRRPDRSSGPRPSRPRPRT